MNKEEQLYKDINWLRYQLFDCEKTFKQISEETGYTKNQLHDWAQKKFHLNAKRIKWDIVLSQRQKQIIFGGMLGDGHIDPSGRYTESHAADEKDYLLWKFKELNTLFTKDYEISLKRKGGEAIIDGVNCKRLDLFSFTSRDNKEVSEMCGLSKIDIISHLDALGFAVYCLNDGSNHFYSGVKKSHSQWTLGTCTFTEEEAEFFVNYIFNKFGIDGLWEYSYDHEKKDIRVRFNALASEQINALILENIPNNLDVVRKKIFQE